MTDINEQRRYEANAYLDGIDMGVAHMCDALGAGKTMAEAIAYARAMGRVSAEHTAAKVGERFTIAQMRARRDACCAEHGVERGAYSSSMNGRKIA